MPESSVSMQTQTPKPSWDRRLFRKFIVWTHSSWRKKVIYVIRHLFPTIFFLYVAIKIQKYSADMEFEFEFDQGFERNWLNITLFSLWIVYGIIFEYSILLLGRKIMVGWMGWNIIISAMLHLTTVILHGRFTLLLLKPAHDALALAIFVLYLWLAQYQHEPQCQLAKIYQFDISFDSDNIGIGESLIEQTIKSLGIDLQKQMIEECCPTASVRMRSPDATIHLIEELSTLVSLWGWIKKSPLSSLEYRDLANQLVLNAEKVNADEESPFSSIHFLERTVPLSTSAFIAALVRKWMKVPVNFVFTLLVIILQASVMPLQSLFLGNTVDAMNSLDKQAATTSLTVWGLLLLVSSVADALVGYSMSGLNAGAMDTCKKQVLSIILNGGTEFMETFPNVANSFSYNMGKLEYILISSTFTLFLASFQLILGSIFAFRLQLSVGFLFVVMIPFILNMDKTAKKALEKSKISSSKQSEVDSQFSATMNCFPVIRSTDTSAWAMKKLEEPLNNYRKARQKSILWSTLVQTYYAMWGNVYLALVVIPWGVDAINSNASSGEFTTLVTLAMGMVTPLNSLGGFLRIVMTEAGSILAIEELLRKGAKLKDSESPSGANCQVDVLKNGLVVSNVEFAYPRSEALVLNGVDFTVRAGTYVALCGGSGSGKSTLLEILMQNRVASGGKIEWDGTDISDCTRASFRRHVGVMFQKTMIIRGSVYENIAFGMETSLADVKKAAQMAEIASVIEALPNSYETIIGGGDAIDLSGGQLQRICLARVLHRKCSVLLLDEATSALDPVSEAAIVETILRLRDTEGLTIISVTHHPVTTVEADEIIVLDKGVIAERGTYADLVEKENGIFHKMVNTENVGSDSEPGHSETVRD